MSDASAKALRMSFGGNSNNSTSLSAMNANETWYTDFVQPLMQRLTKDESSENVKLGPLNIHKVTRCGYTYFYLGTDDSKLLMPRFVTKHILAQSSTVRDMLRALRRESLLIIVNYQFGFKRLEKIKDD